MMSLVLTLKTADFTLRQIQELLAYDEHFDQATALQQEKILTQVSTFLDDKLLQIHKKQKQLE